jgi:hypothetical protein
MTDDEARTEAGAMAFRGTNNLPADLSEWTNAHRQLAYWSADIVRGWAKASEELVSKMDELTKPAIELTEALTKFSETWKHGQTVDGEDVWVDESGAKV